MTLQARLDRIRANFEKDAPPDAWATMHRATDDMRRQGIMDRVVGEGQSAPDFSLEDSRGVATSLASMRQEGPVVLTFFRGDW